MIDRTGPQDKPPPDPPDFAKKHPIRHALGTLAALVWGGIILLAALTVLYVIVSGFFIH